MSNKPKNMHNKLDKLLNELTKFFPTLIVLGNSKKGGCACFNSPENTEEMKQVDLARTIAIMIDSSVSIHNILLAGVCHYLQQNPDEREKMRNALDIMKERHFEAKADIKKN